MKDVLVKMSLKIKQKKLENAKSRETQEETLWIRWWVSYDFFFFLNEEKAQVTNLSSLRGLNWGE